MKQVKIITAQEAAQLVKDGDVHMLQPVGNIALRFVKESGDTDGD